MTKNSVDLAAMRTAKGGLAELKKSYIRAIYREKAFLISEERKKLHHGGESHLYLNHNTFLSKYKNLKLLTNIYSQLILSKSSDEYTLGAVDSVMSPIFCGLLASQLRKDIVVVKEKKLEHGLENKVYGTAKGKIILIDDVTSTGTILVNAANALRAGGAEINHAIVSACRDMSAVNNLEKAGLKVSYVATYEEIIQALWPELTQAEKDIVTEEITEKQYVWSI